MYRTLPLTKQQALQIESISKLMFNTKWTIYILYSITTMAQLHPYSIAELSRCKLLHEASVKDRDLRRLVGHVNMYDKLLDVLNTQEARERDQSPPKSIKTESDVQAGYTRGVVAVEKNIEAFECTSSCDNDSLRRQEDYNAVSVAEVEISDDDD